MPIHIPARLLVAQAMAEHGLLDAMAAGIAGARYRLELYIGEGNTIYFLVVAGVLLALFLSRRRH